MRWLLVVVLALAAAVGIGALLLDDPGTLVLRYGEWAVRTSLAVAVLVLLAAVSAVWLVSRIVGGLGRAPARLIAARRARRQRTALAALDAAALALASDRHAQAERLLRRGARLASHRAPYLLAAARAAAAQGAEDRAGRYLDELAALPEPGARSAALLTRAELALARDDVASARRLLEALGDSDPDNPRRLRLLAEIYARQGAWEPLQALLPRLRHSTALPAPAVARLERRAWLERLRHAADPEATWSAVPRRLRRDPELLAAYVRRLASLGHAERAAALIRKQMLLHWQPELLAVYAELPVDDPATLLAQAERWLRRHHDEPELLRALGRLAQRCGAWEQARRYLERAAERAPDVDTWERLAEVAAAMGDEAAAAGYVRRGLAAMRGQPLAALAAADAVEPAQQRA